MRGAATCALLGCALVVLAAPARAAGSGPAGADAITQAIEARDQRGDVAGARATLLPLLEGRAGDARQRDLAARASFLLGDLDEGARRYADAVSRYEDVLAIDPGNYHAGTARARLESLARYRAGYAELARLDEVRRTPAKQADARELEALVAHARGWTTLPAIRAEALLFAATAFDARLGDRAKACELALVVARDGAADPTTRARAFEIYYAAALARRDWDGLRANVLDDPGAPAGLKGLARRELRRPTLHRAALGVVALGGAAGVVALASTVLRKRAAVALEVLLAPRALVFLAVTILGGAAIAELWTREMGMHFLTFGTALLGVHALAAAWRGGFGDRAPPLRVVGGVTAAACVVAAAYLVLERGQMRGVPLLEGFGL